jgi:hypothetical protein
MWKTLATIMAGIVPGIFIGLAIAMIFIQTPMRAQLKTSQAAETRLTARIATLEGELKGTVTTINATAAAINQRGIANSANLEQIRQVCRAENTRAVAAGRAISAITESSRRTADAVTDLANQCPANELVTADQLRPVLGQTPGS